jgi:hypothetical protein
MGRVDVAINVYGKPFQTAVTLLSLVKFSGDHLGKIYFVIEPKQPRDEKFQFIFDLLGPGVVQHTPRHWLWVNPAEAARYGDDDYRRSIRYQFAWEESDADYLYITHNDVLYTGDIVGALVENIGDCVGIGLVGQCWNCPAHAGGLCSGDKYLDYRPSYDEVLDLARRHPPPRGADYGAYIDEANPWPLPECRLNEWVALVSMKLARPLTVPVGDAPPFGAMGLDIGTQWFRAMSLKGHCFKNYYFDHLAKHGWASEAGNGHSAMFSDDLYENEEAVAREKLVGDFGVSADSLPRPAKRRRSWRGVLRSLRG